MTRYSFLDDYSEGCHPRILEALTSTNMQQQTAYGEDTYSRQARELLKNHIENDQAAVYFVASGTLTNIIVIASCLRPHEAVIAATTGHIAVRETGAIEAVGHKIITVLTEDGKLTPKLIQAALDDNSHFPHMAKPRMVYISNASELGTLYSKKELTALAELCRDKELLLFLDGARLGSALTSEKNDLTLPNIASCVDIFWLGGTKSGALLGEAIIIPNLLLAKDFSFHLKQRGALLAKGRVLGIQFKELFDDGLYFELNRHANMMAERLSSGVIKAGYSLLSETKTNQIFPVIPNPLIKHLQEEFDFYIWQKLEDDKSVIRLVTSWATQQSQVDMFLQKLMNIYC